MNQSKDEKINLNNKEDVLMLFHEIKAENPYLDELIILSAVANVAGWEIPPTNKRDGKRMILRILKVKA
jgi:hypothetical protein